MRRSDIDLIVIAIVDNEAKSSALVSLQSMQFMYFVYLRRAQRLFDQSRNA